MNIGTILMSAAVTLVVTAVVTFAVLVLGPQLPRVLPQVTMECRSGRGADFVCTTGLGPPPKPTRQPEPAPAIVGEYAPPFPTLPKHEFQPPPKRDVSPDLYHPVPN